MKYIHMMRMHGCIYACKMILRDLHTYAWRNFFWQSYSQDYEDLVLYKILGKIKNGTYIDVGCNEPKLINNTYKFYLNGWRGVNIDPNPDCISKMNRVRPDDRNVMCGISGKGGAMIFYEFESHEISTFSKERAKEVVDFGYLLKNKRQVITKPLADVLSVKEVQCDLLLIDVEGIDYEVLLTFPWNEGHPKVVCIETNERFGEDGLKVQSFLSKEGYKRYWTNGVNVIYLHSAFSHKA